MLESPNTTPPFQVDFLDYSALRQIALFCDSKINDYPVGYFIISTICARLADEYDVGPVTTKRANEVNCLREMILAALESPNNVDVLSRLVVADV